VTLGDLLTNLYIDLGYPSSPPTDVTTRLTAQLNKAQRVILREPGLLRLRDTLAPLTFATVANQAVYGLPEAIVRIKAITERTNNRDLDEMTLPELRASDPGLTSTGTPWAYVPLGYRQVQLMPSTTGVWAVSSSASDTTQSAQINGIRSNGLMTGDLSATLTGLTRVAVGSAITDLVDIQSFSIAAVAVGVVSLYDAATNGNLLAQIPVGQTSAQYFTVQLYPTPTSAITYYVDGQLRIPVLNSSQDTPIIPEEFHDVLAAYARRLEYEKTGDNERMASALAEYTLGVQRLKHYVSSQPSEVLVFGQAAHRRFSRFGAWAPATDW